MTDRQKITITSIVCIAFLLGFLFGIYSGITQSTITENDTQYIVNYNGYEFTHNK